MTALEGLDKEAVRRWFRLAADALAQTRAAIDALNVYPVPDSDTGTNLHLTLLSAADAVDGLSPQAGAVEIWRAATLGAMLGACGNSGIIVSQLLRGLSDVCASASPCDGPVVARALEHAAALARAAVSRPAEGTVLTVADAAARAAAEYLGAAALGGSLAGMVTAARAGARLALARTQQQLDVLAASGVVDAGAAGLCVLLDALSAAIAGAAPAAYEVPSPAGRAGLAADQHDAGAASYGYEVTYLLDATPRQIGLLRERLDALGDSLVIVGGEGQWHVHVHVPDAGPAIEEGLRTGTPSRITVTYLGAIRPAGGHRVVAIADGSGLAALLSGAGALVVPHRGGYPPSPAALSAAVRQAGEQVIIVPNGDRVAALARAAAARLGEEGIEVSVVGIRSPVQALAAVAVHDPHRDFRIDAAAMSRAAASMRYASVGPAGSDAAGRDGAGSDAARSDGARRAGEAAGHAGETVGRLAEDVAVRGASQGDVAIAVTDLLLAGGAELVTLVEGEGATDGLADLVAGHVREICPAADLACYDGGPADAFLLIGAE
jgi:DAK2 domain fusion protein YloV